MLLFAGLVAAAYAGLFNVLETRFYQPSVVRTMETQLGTVAGALADWHDGNAKRFSAFVADEAVKRSVLPNQSAQDIFDRANLAGALMAEMPGVAGIRILDSAETAPAGEADTGRRRIHFSTFKEDILKKEDFRVVYEYYGRSGADIPATALAIPPGETSLIVTDAANDRFLYCFPFYDAYSTLRGTAVFYVSARSAIQKLVSLNLVRLSDNLTLLASEDHAVEGAVAGMPRVGESILTRAILDRWGRKDLSAGRVVEGEADGSGWILLSRDAGSAGFVGQLVAESVFSFSRAIRILFLSIAFLTIFLVLFLLFNLRQDSMVIVRSRIRKFQVKLLEELLEKGVDTGWEEIGKNLAYRKHDVSAEIKKGFGRRIAKKHGKDIDELLDKSWEEILSAIGRQSPKQTAVTSTEEIRLMLEQVLQNNAISLNLTGVPVAQGKPRASGDKSSAAKAQKTATAPATAKVDEGEALEEVEALEEIEEAEAVEEAEAIEEVEAVEELEEVEAIEEAEAVEELEEAEAIEEAEAVEELEEAEAIEEAEAVEELEEAEAIEEAEAAETSGPTHDIPFSATAFSGEMVAGEGETQLEELEELEEIDGNEPPKAKPVAGVSEEVSTIVEEIAAIAEAVSPSEESVILGPDDTDFMSVDLSADYGTSGIILEEAEEPEAAPEPEEVEYLEAEWEPDLLEVATDEELADFIEESVPDHVLVYNFDERPSLGPIPGAGAAEEAGESPSIIVESPDFTSLDSLDTEDATEVDYIDSFLLNVRSSAPCAYADEAAIDLLEIVGEEGPADLLDLVEVPDLSEESAIVSENGLFVIAPKADRPLSPSIDPAFKELVDSVLQ
jgi:hypothetical protein